MQVIPRSFYGFYNIVFRFGIECARRLIENDYRRILREHARYLHALTLTAGEILAALCQLISVAAVALHDILVELRIARRHYHFEILYGIIPHFYIVCYGILKKDDILIHYGKRAGKYASVYLRNGLAVKKYFTAPRLIKPRYELESVDLPHPEGPTKATRLPGRSVMLKFSISGSARRE